MTKSIKIAVDAMGGDNSPKKIIDGIEIYYNENQDVFYNIFGDKNVIEKLILDKSIKKENYELIHTEEKIKGEDSALSAAKRGKKYKYVARYRKCKKQNLRHCCVSR